jgi:PIN domain nuclease of toxin-antitoxin system
MQVTPERLSMQTQALLADPDNQLFLSSASSWEIAIKYSIGKLPLPMSPTEYVLSRMETSGTSALPVLHTHALHVATLPPHHKDPFDRLLIAQAQLEGLKFLSADHQMEAYDVEIVWA